MVKTRQSIHFSPRSKPATLAMMPKLPPPKREMFTPDQILWALRSSRGKISAAARLLGCGRACVYEYQAKYPEIEQTLTDEREMQLDLTELALFRAIDNGESWAILFYLKTQGRERGYYIQKQRDGHDDGATLEQLVLAATDKWNAIQAERKGQAHG